jgi:hypothetical protein
MIVPPLPPQAGVVDNEPEQLTGVEDGPLKGGGGGGGLQPAKKNVTVGGGDPAIEVLENSDGSCAFALTLSPPHTAPGSNVVIGGPPKTISPPKIGKP